MRNFRSLALLADATLLPRLWCTGKDSNLRSPIGRQIYSLLPLTTRPPVPILLSPPDASFCASAPARRYPVDWERCLRGVTAEDRPVISRGEQAPPWNPGPTAKTLTLRARGPHCEPIELELAKGFEPPTV